MRALLRAFTGVRVRRDVAKRRREIVMGRLDGTTGEPAPRAGRDGACCCAERNTHACAADDHQHRSEPEAAHGILPLIVGEWDERWEL